MDIESILKILTGGVGAIAALFFGLRWLSSDREKVLRSLHEEREARIVALEEGSKRCAEDRIVLHRTIDDLQKEIRQLYLSMISNAAKCGAGCVKDAKIHPSGKAD